MARLGSTRSRSRRRGLATGRWQASLTQMVATSVRAGPQRRWQGDIIDNQGSNTVEGFQNTGSGFLRHEPFCVPAVRRRMVYGNFTGRIHRCLDQAGNVRGSITLYLNNANGTFTFTSIAKPSGAFTSTFQRRGLYHITTTNFWLVTSTTTVTSILSTPRIRLALATPSPRVATPSIRRRARRHPPGRQRDRCVDGNIVITFDGAVSKGTGTIQIIRTSDNSVFESFAVTDARVTGSGTTWTINPNGARRHHQLRGAHRGWRVPQFRCAIFFGINDNTTLNFVTADGPRS